MELDIERLRRALLDFYDRQRRDLPWRREQDPYRILVSEVMLQQTRVETVLGYYERWVERFPDLAALARADEQDVLRAWEGLGYYRRARSLHAAARVVAGYGEPPNTAAELRRLPGVGEYTAGAVASIAYGEVVPAVDGNVRRVLARLFDEPAPGAGWLRRAAGALVDPERPGDWNQALMELGATVCTPRSPACDACPVARHCAAWKAGTVSERPAPSPRRTPRVATMALALLQRSEGEVLLVRRPPDGLLGGMWTLPEREVDAPGDAPAAARDLAAELLGVPARGPARPLLPVRHRFTHIDATYLPWALDGAHAAGAPAAGVRWTTSEQRADLPIPVAQRKVLVAAAEAGSVHRDTRP